MTRRRILAPQLCDGVIARSRPRMGEADRLHGTKGEDLFPPACHFLDGKTPLKVHGLLEGVKGDLLGLKESLPEELVLLLG